MTAIDATQGGARLIIETRNLVITILNGLEARRTHPTYGYTKTQLRAQVAQLQGRLDALYWLQGGAGMPLSGDHNRILRQMGKPTLQEFHRLIDAS